MVCDPKLFKALLVENYLLNTLFLPSNVIFLCLTCLRDNYFDKNEFNVTLQVLKCLLDAIQHQFSYKI